MSVKMSYTKDDTHCMIPFIRNSRKGKSLLSESRSVAAWDRDRGRKLSPEGLENAVPSGRTGLHLDVL